MAEEEENIQELENKLQAAEQKRMQECMAEINVVLKKYGYSLATTLDAVQLGKIMAAAVANFPKTVRLVKGG